MPPSVPPTTIAPIRSSGYQEILEARFVWFWLILMVFWFSLNRTWSPDNQVLFNENQKTIKTMETGLKYFLIAVGSGAPTGSRPSWLLAVLVE